MCISVHIVPYVFQGGLDRHLWFVSAAKQMQALGFCIICRLYLNRQKHTFIIGYKIQLRIGFGPPEITVYAHTFQLRINIVFRQRSFIVDICSISFQNGSVVYIGFFSQKPHIRHINFKICMIRHP